MKIKEKIAAALSQTAAWIYGILFLIILYLVIFKAAEVDYAYKGDYPWANWIYLVLGVVLWILLRWTQEYYPLTIRRFVNKHSGKLIVGATVLLFVIQLFAVYNYYFETGWDSYVLVNTSQTLADGYGFDIESDQSYYYSTYPNNFLMVFVFSNIIRIGNIIGIGPIMAILIVQCMISAVTGFLVFRIIYLWRGLLREAWNVWLLYVLILGFSPWVSIPYSDAMGLIFPALILYLYVSARKGKYFCVKVFLLAAVSVFAYKIKPQLLILFIALLIVLILKLIKGGIAEKKAVIKGIGCGIGGIVFMMWAVSVVTGSVDIATDDEAVFSPAHYIMMGLNPVTNGGYLEEDVYFSHVQPEDERVKANLQVAHERIEEYGASGMSEHLLKKMLTNYADGTWAWGAEGGFYSKVFEDKNQWISPFLKSIYYYDGSRYGFFLSYSQTMWMLLLAGCFLTFLFRGKKIEGVVLVMMLSVVGLSLFEMIFEARARYLYCYVPIYILLAYTGLENLWGKLQRRKRNV